MQKGQATYHSSWFRWQQRDAFALWVDRVEPERESLWADAQGRVPLFPTERQLAAFVTTTGAEIKSTMNAPLDFDVVYAWLHSPAEWRGGTTERPVAYCLDTWNMFNDLSAGVGEAFAGDEKSPQRNRVYDLLYGESGPFIDDPEMDVPWRIPEGVHWLPADIIVLKHILRQGFDLWQHYTYRTANFPHNLN